MFNSVDDLETTPLSAPIETNPWGRTKEGEEGANACTETPEKRTRAAVKNFIIEILLV